MHNRERTLNSLFIAEEMRLESHILVLSLTNLTNMRSTILLTNISIWALKNQLIMQICACGHLQKYRVIHKKVSHKTEDKMDEKLKMILQKDENLAHIQQQYGDST